MADDTPRREEAAGEQPHAGPVHGAGARVRDIARRLFPGEGADVRDAVVSVLATGDKAKTEMVRMVAREARHYLEELKIGEDIQELLTNYSLEVHASVSLKPLAGKKAKKRVAAKKKPSAKR
jgi:hypothetical protein